MDANRVSDEFVTSIVCNRVLATSSGLVRNDATSPATAPQKANVALSHDVFFFEF